MNMKKIMLFSAILIIAISSLSIVSAGWFDSGVSVNGIDFNLPDGYKEVEGNNYVDNYLSMGYKGESGVYEDDNGHIIWISVLDKNSEGKAVSFGDMVVSSTDFKNLKNTTISGKTGTSYEYSSPTQKAFVYVEGDKLVDIRVPGSVNFEDIIK